MREEDKRLEAPRIMPAVNTVWWYDLRGHSRPRKPIPTKGKQEVPARRTSHEVDTRRPK